MNSRYGDTNWDEDSEFTRLADAIAGKHAASKGTGSNAQGRNIQGRNIQDRNAQGRSAQGSSAQGARPERIATPHHPRVHLRAGSGRRNPIKAAARNRVNGGLIALGLLAAITGALVTHQLLDQPVAPDAQEERRDPQDYTLKPTPAVDALGKALPIWVRVVKPAVTVINPAASLKGVEISYETWQHGLGGQRDIAIFGRFVSGPYLFIAFYRQGEEAQIAPTFFVDAARQAAEAGIGVIRTDVPVARSTKFGPAEIANGILTNGKLRRDCLVFRNRSFDRGMTISGWACGTTDRPIDADTLACMIDGTGFAAGDSALHQLLAASEAKRRSACVAPPAAPAKPPQRRS
ncbi:hypothetical protein [Chelatococcus asaccharovorans]|uniref:Uncharacterized protein n=1 Tax=Chelatococcus asaccharovorans TaxID=28210 RepID=A0A2V3U920_9HYPH|nr:hypothetical protein [Chelatococcus asaccharovorans]MBS7705793.1 hypothetical protein [Chelatococcus asaccharovorans]PXW58814.1 hypothetical protein C7450_105162 [Chelatococcus asaccharovorans]